MHNWNSISHIIRELNLRSEPSDIKAVQNELRAKLAEYHPDYTGGEFLNEEIKGKFHQIKSAIDYTKSLETKSLVPVECLPEIVRAVAEALQPISKNETINLQERFIYNFRKSQKHRSFTPRITCGTLATVSGLLATFPEIVLKHPVTRYIISTSNHQTVIETGISALFGLLFIVTNFIFLLLWIQEKRQIVVAEYMVSEQGCREIFNYLCQNYLVKDSNGKLAFSNHDLIEALEQRKSPTRGLIAELKILEEASEVLLSKLKNRGVINDSKILGVEQWYEVAPEFVVKNQLRSREENLKPTFIQRSITFFTCSTKRIFSGRRR